MTQQIITVLQKIKKTNQTKIIKISSNWLIKFISQIKPEEETVFTKFIMIK